MAAARIFMVLVLIGISVGSEEQGSRSTRTISRFFGTSPAVESNPQPQPQSASPQQQPIQAAASQQRKPVPLIYSVKYYDRTGEGEKADVIPEHAVVQDGSVPARVFLNLYSGQQQQQQQTPVYYDNKGQVLVPCPVYDHLYVAGVDPSIVRKSAPVAQKVVQTVVPVPPPVSVPHAHVQTVPELVYYAPSPFVGHTHNPTYKPTVQTGLGHHGGVAVVGNPFDYPYFPGYYPYGSPGYNPYVFIKPTPSGIHGPTPTVQVQSAVTQLVDKKEGDKLE